jgi:hypothetical protein
MAVAALPFIIAGASAATSMVGSLQQSAQEARVAEFNAAVAQTNAIQERAFAEADAMRVRDQASRAAGRTRVMAAAAGVDTGTGSVLDILSDDAIQFELDALNIQARGEAGARAHESQAAMQRAQARHTRRQAPLSALGAGLQGFGGGFRAGQGIAGAIG